MELLSPAGSYESLKAAILSGADAIYIGGVRFSARRNAKNFSDNEIIEAINLCHLYGVKLYVALNILIKETEFSDAVNYAKFLIESGVDGIIVQDLGLISAIRKLSDEIFINASTQMTIASTEGVNVAKKLGANRVVLAREVGICEMKSIRENTDIELETFVHGALCMSWSGQCLISSVIGGRSGNRGLCAQPCRLLYTLLKDGKEMCKPLPLLSLKDICLADKLSELDGVVDSLKIEGRMKSPEYTASVTSLYKKAMMQKISQAEINKTLSFFSRGGSSTGYFYGRGFSDMMDYDVSSKVSADKEDIALLKVEDFSKKRPISMKLTAKTGEKLTLFAESGEFTSFVCGDMCEAAIKGFDRKRAEEQLKKLGDTPFIAETIEILSEDNPFVPVSAINALRRAACQQIEEKITNSYKRSAKDFIVKESKYKKRPTPRILVEVSTKEQLEAAKKEEGIEIITGYELSKCEKTEFSMCPAVKKEGEKTKPPSKKIMVQNLGQIDEKYELYGGERLNVTNSYSCEILRELGFRRVTLSPELNVKEIKNITKETDIETEIIAYGHIPVMVMENCVIKSQGMCSECGGKFELSDRKGEHFPIICENCKNIVLNSVPIYMADKGEDLLSLNVDVIRLKFTIESRDETKTIIDAYKCALLGKTPKGTVKKLTRGHFYRGVE